MWRALQKWVCSARALVCIMCQPLTSPFPQHFPLSFPAGDVADERSFYRLPNPVYNSLKLHARGEEQRSQRLHDKKERATHVRQEGWQCS